MPGGQPQVERTTEVPDAPVRRAPFRPDIEGLRAIAVALVVLYHARLPGLTGGYVGVDVFFVISGFLITNHLATELTRTGRISFGTFYARRMRRILPASFVVLAITTVAAALWMPPLRISEVVDDVIATALYVPNMWFAHVGTDYLAGTAPSPVQHYWSLGVEEQFYLVWPALLVVATLLVRRSRRSLVVVVGVIIAASFALDLLVMTISPTWAFFSLPTRAWELGVGGLVALTLPALTGRRLTASPLVVAAGLVLVIGSAVVFDDRTPFPGAAAAVPVLGTALAIVGAAGGTGGAPGRLLRSRPFQSLGRWSYSTYLWHWPLLVIVESRLVTPLPLWASLCLGVAAVPLAAITYRTVEDPLRHLPFLVQRPAGITLLAGAAASMLVIVLALGLGRWSQTQALSADQTAEASALDGSPVFTSFVPSNLRPSLRSAATDLPAAYADGCQVSQAATALSACVYGDPDAEQSIALFGDSHATQWLPALDRFGTEQHYRIELYGKSACPSADVVLATAEDEACRLWRDRAIATIAADPPAIVVLSNSGRQTWPEPATAEAKWREGLSATLDRLPSTSEIAVIGTTPSFDDAPATCLSAHLSDANTCARPRTDVLSPARLRDEAAVATEHGARYFPAADHLCSASSCGAIVGDMLLYRDDHHLTAVAAAALSGQLTRFLLDD